MASVSRLPTAEEKWFNQENYSLQFNWSSSKVMTLVLFSFPFFDDYEVNLFFITDSLCPACVTIQGRISDERSAKCPTNFRR
jgi:hypothetical protein